MAGRGNGCLVVLNRQFAANEVDRKNARLDPQFDGSRSAGSVGEKGETLTRMSVEEIGVGDVIVVKPGEKIPLDGDILAGHSSVNQAPITGESIPVDKQAGDAVFAGSVNESGALEIKVTKLVADTAIARIIHLVEEAQEKKLPRRRLSTSLPPCTRRLC